MGLMNSRWEVCHRRLPISTVLVPRLELVVFCGRWRPHRIGAALRADRRLKLAAQARVPEALSIIQVAGDSFRSTLGDGDDISSARRYQQSGCATASM